ncbi:MAG: hypothetical protein CMJ78_16085 [Planctomycetaceae bacterium]|nr:hypothetical protein [Planctomycetaceae bacterium]
MLKWLRSKATCPVGAEEKVWIEERFGWLADQFTCEQLRSGTTILPTTDFFPASFERTDEEIVELLDRVAMFMDVDPMSVRLNYYEETHPKFNGQWSNGSAGMYSESDGQYDIWLEVSTLEDPLAVVSTIAHELGHVLLLGQNRLTGEEEDHEELTDLLTVFMGLGILTSNSVMNENYWFSGGWTGWEMSRRGYITMEMYGYALALYAMARSEFIPDWLTHLRPDVRSACKNGIRYIQESQDCNFRHIRFRANG